MTCHVFCFPFSHCTVLYCTALLKARAECFQAGAAECGIQRVSTLGTLLLLTTAIRVRQTSCCMLQRCCRVVPCRAVPCQGTQVAWRSWACGRNRCAEPCAIYRQTAMDDKSGRFYGPIKGASLTEPNRTESTKSTEADSRCWDSARLDSTGM